MSTHCPRGRPSTEIARKPFFAERRLDRVGDRADVAIALTRHEDQEVRVVDLAGDIDDLDFTRFFVEAGLRGEQRHALGFFRRTAVLGHRRAEARSLEPDAWGASIFSLKLGSARRR